MENYHVHPKNIKSCKKYIKNLFMHNIANSVNDIVFSPHDYIMDATALLSLGYRSGLNVIPALSIKTNQNIELTILNPKNIDNLLIAIQKEKREWVSMLLEDIAEDLINVNKIEILKQADKNNLCQIDLDDITTYCKSKIKEKNSINPEYIELNIMERTNYIKRIYPNIIQVIEEYPNEILYVVEPDFNNNFILDMILKYDNILGMITGFNEHPFKNILRNHGKMVKYGNGIYIS